MAQVGATKAARVDAAAAYVDVGRTACVDVVGIPHRRWQDQMRDESIQCD